MYFLTDWRAIERNGDALSCSRRNFKRLPERNLKFLSGSAITQFHRAMSVFEGITDALAKKIWSHASATNDGSFLCTATVASLMRNAIDPKHPFLGDMPCVSADDASVSHLSMYVD